MIPRWLMWTVLALVSWGAWAVIAKLIGEALSGAQSQALSTIGILPVMLALALSKRIRGAQRPMRGSILAFAAGALTCGGNVAYYEILKGGAKAATVVPLTALYPMVTVILAVPLLKERLNRVQVIGVILALAAIYLFNVQQDGGFFNSSLVFALIPIGLWGLAGLLQKISTNTISGELSTLWFLAASIPVAILLFVREPVTDSPGMKIHLLVALLGFTWSLGNYAILEAFASGGKASIISPLAGLYFIFSVPAALIFFGERVGLRESLGIAIALAAVAAISIESKSSATETAKT